MSSLNKMVKYEINFEGKDGKIERIELYDFEKYLDSRRRLDELKEQIDVQPTISREDSLAIVREAMRRAIEICKEIYEPLIDQNRLEKVRQHGSNDYLTDFKGLDSIPELFSKMENLDLTQYNGGDLLRISWDRGNGELSRNYFVDKIRGRSRLVDEITGIELDLTKIGVITNMEKLVNFN